MIIILSKSVFFISGMKLIIQQSNNEEIISQNVITPDFYPCDIEFHDEEKTLILIDHSTHDIALLIDALNIKLLKPKAIVISFINADTCRTYFEDILLNALSSYISDYRIHIEFVREIISTALLGEVITLPAQDVMWMHLAEQFQITKRETIIFIYIICGYNNKQIARLLKLSCKTISLYRANIYKKLHVKNVSGLGMFLNQDTLSYSAGM
ncbi:LuxR C-terminal-related transcriptional regulator [Pseudenterobacter timonensis]|uniref:LuxR C-terminal-related transcriptional regulator n=1 Tax=Pseudenterobacter timonensis TaxID=1755099 RepID=A0AAE4DPF6_9ENTR|nr:LuxR C-terminal-related transcriptional regulator [Pseudenterobacter timonensis]MDR9891508.1 LuxR C-terminal-related transcriptional regulator [Pseudenterobacter timonensis]